MSTDTPVPTAGSPNLVPKHQTIAQSMVGNAKVIHDALLALTDLQLQYLQAGTFNDTDFVGVNAIQQLNAYQVGLFLTTVVPALQTWYTTALSGGTVPRDLILQILS